MTNEALALYFNEKEHAYTDSNGFKYTSATTVIAKYEEEFDTKGMAQRCSRSRASRYYGMAVPHIIKLWKEMNTTALDKGNRIHNFLEERVKQATGYKLVDNYYINDKIYTVNNVEESLSLNSNIGELDLEWFSKAGIETKYPRIFKLIGIYVSMGYRIFSEIGIFDPTRLISGLIDILLINFEKREFIILDWKTNKSKIIPFDDERYKWVSGYFKKDKMGQITDDFVKTNVMLKYPLNRYQQSTFIIYSLQLSIYTTLVERLGFTSQGIVLAHIREDELYEEGDAEVIRIPELLGKSKTDLLNMSYLKEEVNAMLDHHFQTYTDNNQAQLI